MLGTPKHSEVPTMMYIILIAAISAAAWLWMRQSSKQNIAREEKEKRLSSSAIDEGRQAAKEGRTESECPYNDGDGRDPGNKPIGVLALLRTGPFEGQRFWWIAGFRQELRGQPESNPQSRSAEISSARSEATREFLYPLTGKEKVAVTGLSPAVYRAIIMSKRAYTGVTSMDVDTSKSDVGALLLKLDVADLERLAESLEFTREADRAAASDFAKAEQLYQKALQINPFDALAAMSCGVALAKQGDLRGGLKWIERAHDLDPDNERIMQNLAELKAML
jgi:tetratricopeptide (TPR) repeat protein